MVGELSNITAGQLRKLWVSARQVGLSDPDVHQLVLLVTGKESIRTLTSEEASRVIDQLVGEGTDRPRTPLAPRERRPPLPENVIELATEKQVGMIGRLLWHLGWGVNDEYFRACVRQAIGRENVRTKREASKVIEMLRAKLRELGLEGQATPSHRQASEG